MKSIFNSKTFWVNVIGIIGIVVQQITGKNLITPELQVAILGLINIVLRSITKEAVTWK